MKIATEMQIEKLVLSYGAKIRSQGKHHVDLEIRTPTSGYASLSVSLTERRFGGQGFNPQGWTLQHFLSANAAMSQLLTLAVELWDLCEVQS